MDFKITVKVKERVKITERQEISKNTHGENALFGA
jgi:hypothetical protein